MKMKSVRKGRSRSKSKSNGTIKNDRISYSESKFMAVAQAESKDERKHFLRSSQINIKSDSKSKSKIRRS
jgi:hypothetical protein